MLPDDVLLEIFDFYVNGAEPEGEEKTVFEEKVMIESWQTLVHVCRRWRTVVFGSPRRLDLQLVCTSNTRAGDTLDVWPPLPLSIRAEFNDSYKIENIIPVLQCSDRVHKIILENIFSSELEDVLKAMQEPFPGLTDLVITVWLSGETDDTEPVLPLPDSFLGGSTPRLQSLRLSNIPFVALPKLLLSATHLAYLYLEKIPHSGYIPPKAMVTALSTLTNLQMFHLTFQSPLSRPDRASRLLPPPTRSDLPFLTTLKFKGVGDYLDDLVTYIDAHQLDRLDITLFNQIFFETPEFIQFIRRTPAFKALDRSHVVFGSFAAEIILSLRTSPYPVVSVEIPCKELDWQISSLEQVCTSCLPPLSALEDLYVSQKTHSKPDWKDNVEDSLWLELLHPFPTVGNFFLSEEFAPRIAPALEELVGARTTEVLPTLQNIFVEGLGPSGPVQEGIRKFVAARQVTSLPLSVSPWDGSWPRWA